MSRYNRYSKFQTTCAQCGATTTKAFARGNAGKCKTCVTGVVQRPRFARCADDIARENGYEDSMGVSPEVLESYRNGGSYGGLEPNDDL